MTRDSNGYGRVMTLEFQTLSMFASRLLCHDAKEVCEHMPLLGTNVPILAVRVRPAPVTEEQNTLTPAYMTFVGTTLHLTIPLDLTHG